MKKNNMTGVLVLLIFAVLMFAFIYVLKAVVKKENKKI